MCNQESGSDSDEELESSSSSGASSDGEDDEDETLGGFIVPDSQVELELRDDPVEDEEVKEGFRYCNYISRQEMTNGKRKRKRELKIVTSSEIGTQVPDFYPSEEYSEEEGDESQQDEEEDECEMAETMREILSSKSLVRLVSKSHKRLRLESREPKTVLVCERGAPGCTEVEDDEEEEFKLGFS